MLGDGDFGDEAHSQAMAILERLWEASPEDFDLQHQVAAMALAIGSASRSGQEPYLRKAVEVAKELRQPTHRLTYAKACYAYAFTRSDDVGSLEKVIDVMRELAEERPNVTRYQNLLGQLYRSRFPDIVAVQQAVQIHEKLAERFPSNFELVAELGVSLRYLGRALQDAGELHSAVQAYESAAEKLETTTPHLIGELRTAYVQLRDTQHEIGNVDAETEAARRALHTSQEIRKHRPDSPRHIGWESLDRLYMAALLERTGRLDEAIGECTAAVTLVETVFDGGTTPDAPMHSIFAARLAHRDALRDLGRYHSLQANYDEAANTYLRAIDAETQIVRDVPRSLVHESPNPLYDGFISACHNSDRVDEVEAMLRNELETWRELEQRSAFTDTCQLRQLEVQLRLAEHCLASNRLQLASVQYRGCQSLLETLLSQEQIKAKTISTCLHVTSTLHTADIPDCQERSQILEMLRPHVDHEGTGANCEGISTSNEVN